MFSSVFVHLSRTNAEKAAFALPADLLEQDPPYQKAKKRTMAWTMEGEVDIIENVQAALCKLEGKRIRNMNINLADMRHIDSCVAILQHSDLGRAYFSDGEKAKNLLTYAVKQKDVYVALDDDEKCLGFVYYLQKGVFGSYPYLHIIAVKEEYRGLGIGKQLMQFFEENASEFSSTKLFLTVDDFNPRAKKLYENLGYHCVGELPDFYKEGINCYLMMKRKG